MQTTSFTFKQPKDDLFYLVAATVIIITAFYFLVQIISYQGLGFNTLPYLIPPLVVATPGVLLIMLVMLRKQYREVDSGKELELDEINCRLHITRNNKTYIISSDDIKDFEVHDSSTTTWLFRVLSLIGYIKINLMDGCCLVITKFTATEDELYPILQGKESTRTSRFMNKISDSDLQNCIC